MSRFVEWLAIDVVLLVFIAAAGMSGWAYAIVLIMWTNGVLTGRHA